jgi:hypothetical protein
MLLYSKNIRAFISGILFLWTLFAILPSIVIYSSNNIEKHFSNGNLEGEPQQEEEKQEFKKEYFSSHLNREFKILSNTNNNKIIFNILDFYNSPTHDIVVPPPKKC